MRLLDCTPIRSLTVTVQRFEVVTLVTSNLVPNAAELYAAVNESRCILAPDAVVLPCMLYQVAMCVPGVDAVTNSMVQHNMIVFILYPC